MITPWDESYARTKAIKVGMARLEPPFLEFVAWLNEFYEGIGAINAWVETGPKLVVAGKSALRIAFERDTAVGRLSFGPFKQNPSEAERILAEFRRVAARHGLADFDTDNMFVTYSSFEQVARCEANSNVSDEDLFHLKRSLADLCVWEVKPDFDVVTFFFETDEQLAASEANGARRTCETLYRSILGRYDEFGYFRERPIEVSFYSHQSFNRVYHNWFNWSRR
jgi:hypothetical protein